MESNRVLVEWNATAADYPHDKCLHELFAGQAAHMSDAVALVCTEIPLLITADVSPLPILDSTRLLAKAAVEVALGELPIPEWRGGPI